MQQLSLKPLARRLVQCLERAGIVVEALYLFGSHARDEATEDSDIDILLVSPSFVGKPFWTRCMRTGEALSDIAEPVQLYPVTLDEFRRPEPGGWLVSLAPDLQPL
jgi:predicted nucleotidyltransferase